MLLQICTTNFVLDFINDVRYQIPSCKIEVQAIFHRKINNPAGAPEGVFEVKIECRHSRIVPTVELRSRPISNFQCSQERSLNKLSDAETETYCIKITRPRARRENLEQRTVYSRGSRPTSSNRSRKGYAASFAWLPVTVMFARHDNIYSFRCI